MGDGGVVSGVLKGSRAISAVFLATACCSSLWSAQAFAFCFNVPTPSLVANTVSGRAITARQVHRSSNQHASPSPRMAIASAAEGRRTTGVSPIISRDVGGGVLATPPAGESAKAPRLDGKSPDFEVNLGRLISTLQVDYPRIFFETPSFDVYTEDIELFDPTGVAFKGLGNYKRVFATLRFFRQVLMKDANTTFRLTYDWSKQQVRLTWKMVLVLKARPRPVYVDGISAYHVNSDGNAYRHELETVVVNGTPVEPPFAYAWINLPAWVAGNSKNQPVAIPAPFSNSVVSSPDFFAAAYAAAVATDLPSANLADLQDANKVYDTLVGDDLMGTFETEPEVRADFLKALVVLDSVSSMDSSVGSEAIAEVASSEDEGDAAVAALKENRRVKEKKEGGWFGVQGPTECDTSWDCTGGMVCCDFLLVKVCCSNGVKQPKFGDLIPSLVPIPGRGRNENDTPAPKRPPPRNGGSSNGKITW